MTGTTIILATQPVDPFDIFRGQYISILYEISTIPLIEGAKEGNAVYVVLKEYQGNIWRFEKASLEKPSKGIFIKGSIKSVGSNLRVEYGIEQYFFERHAEFPTINLTVEAKVSKSGQARIVQLLHDGKPLRITYKKPSLTS